jgi:hypothetical protein
MLGHGRTMRPLTVRDGSAMVEAKEEHHEENSTNRLGGAAASFDSRRSTGPMRRRLRLRSKELHDRRQLSTQLYRQRLRLPGRTMVFILAV